MKRVVLIMLAALLTVISTVGCNTMGGFGKDLSNTGKNIENAGK
ncbi:MAG: entericidin A/B family lipoprotein [Candidatus Omnitrophica bacterium]|nr:entericidin A/B family lipoprotein [Candidatus Omnitrophota bacterium]